MWYFLEKHPKKVVFSIAVFGLALALMLSFINGHIFKTEFSDYRTDAEIYNLMALSLIDTGSIYAPDGTFYGSLRAPGYPLFLSMAYSVYRSPISAWVFQVLIYIASVFVLWRLSRHFFKGFWALIPPLLYAVSWFVGAFVIRLNSDFLAMFFVLVGVWTLVEYVNIEKYKIGGNLFAKHGFLALSTISFALSALVRPVMLFVIFILAVYIMLVNWRHVFPYITLFVLVLLPAMAVNYANFDTPTFSDSGFVIKMRAQELNLPLDRLYAFYIASVVGDLIADQYLPGYKYNPEPYPRIQAVSNERTMMRDNGTPFKEMNNGFYSDGLSLIAEQPLKFMLGGLFNLIHLHNPPNQNGTLMTHFLAEKNSLDLVLRIVANIALRALWFCFIAIAFIGALLLARKKDRLYLLMPIYLLTFYIVSIHAFFTHAEFRFILGVIPFYLLFFSQVSVNFFTKIKNSYFLERFLRYLRYRVIVNKIADNTKVCDIGCGSGAYLLRGLSGVIKSGVGIDSRTQNSNYGNIELKNGNLNDALPLLSNSFDIVSMLAVLEHIDNDEQLLLESFRILKPGGKILITVPTHANKYVGEFLSYKLKLINPEHYRDHKRYYNKKELTNFLIRAGFQNIRSHYWEFGMNLYAEGQK